MSIALQLSLYFDTKGYSVLSAHSPLAGSTDKNNPKPFISVLGNSNLPDTSLQEQSSSLPRMHPRAQWPNGLEEMSTLQKHDFISSCVYPTAMLVIRCLRDGDNPRGMRTFPYG